MKRSKNYFGYKSRNAYLKKKYGISEKTYNLMLEKQGGRCAICQKPASSFKKRLAVDHDHKTLKVRGLLCEQCNRGLGRFYDSTEVVRRAYLYLQRA